MGCNSLASLAPFRRAIQCDTAQTGGQGERAKRADVSLVANNSQQAKRSVCA